MRRRSVPTETYVVSGVMMYSCAGADIMLGMPPGMHLAWSMKLPCPPWAWSAMLSSWTFWYSGVSGASCAGPNRFVGRYDVLEVETRGFKGPRSYDASGLPLHFDNQSVFKERIHLDKADPNLIHDEITVIDHALTRPWTVDKRYVRTRNSDPQWPEYVCAEGNLQVFVGDQHYFISGDGLLMPTQKDQPPPDLRYFQRK